MISDQPFEYSVLASIHMDMDFDNALVILAPTDSSCLRVIDGNHIELPQSVLSRFRSVAGYSQIDRIQTDGTHAQLPPQIFGSEPPHTWCYYFERAELARQVNDWPLVGQLGDEASERGYSPDDETEWQPFIGGYIQLGRCEAAQELITLAEQAVPPVALGSLPSCKLVLR
jgi:hypothetical protein